VIFTGIVEKRMLSCVSIIFISPIISHFIKDGCSGKDAKKRELVFPLLMRNNCDFFSFKDSSFLIQKDRESTARV